MTAHDEWAKRIERMLPFRHVILLYFLNLGVIGLMTLLYIPFRYLGSLVSVMGMTGFLVIAAFVFVLLVIAALVFVFQMVVFGVTRGWQRRRLLLCIHMLPTVLVGALSYHALVGYYRPPGCASPDGSFIVRPRIDLRGSIFLHFFTRDGDLLFKANTRTNVAHRWSVEWAGDDKVLFRSSDIGPSYWVYQQDGSWKRVSPFKKLSPNGKLVVYTYWDSRGSYNEKTLTITLLKADGDVDAASTVVYTIPTDLVIPTLIDCARWEGNETIVITGQDKEYRWRQRFDGSWEEAE